MNNQIPQPDLELPGTVEERRIANNQDIRDRMITGLAGDPMNFKDPEMIKVLCGVLNDSDRTSIAVIKQRSDDQTAVSSNAMLDMLAKVVSSTAPVFLPSQRRQTPVMLDSDIKADNIVPGEMSHDDSSNYDTFAKQQNLPQMAKK